MRAQSFFCLFLILGIAFSQSTTKKIFHIKENYEIIEGAPNIFDEKSYVAWLEYAASINETGWNQLKMKTNKYFPDNTQMKLAGFLEGYITQQQMWECYENFVNSVLEGNNTIDTRAVNYINDQLEYMKNEVLSHPHDEYWQLVGTLMNLIQGIYQGYLKSQQDRNQPAQYLDFKHFYYIINMGDLEDIISQRQFAECNCYAKIANGKLFAGHDTWNMFFFELFDSNNRYPLMLKTFKIYDFQLNNPIVVNNKVSFSSRPGDITSKDDFYVVYPSEIIASETSLMCYNQSLYDTQSPQTLPSWVRSNIANRISRSAKEWTENFQKHFSGTHNAQWMVVDFKQFKAGEKTEIIYMIEQYFTHFYAKDVTQDLLIENGYYASYNVPYHQELWDISGYNESYNYTYWTDPRAKIFHEYKDVVQDMESFKTLMRTNKNEVGDPCQSIAARCDLRKKGEYDYGAIDSKLIDSDLIGEEKIWIILGPTTADGNPPFEFTGEWEKLSHVGMPIKYEFDWIFHSLTTNDDAENIN